MNMGLSKNNRYDVIVIGAGLGGLSCALHFAKRGRHVLVLEKHPKVGGYCQGYLRGDYELDVSLHVLSALNEGGGLRRLLVDLGVWDKLEVVSHDPMFTAAFPDETFDMPAGLEPVREYLKSRFPRERGGVDRYLDTMKRIVEDNGRLFWTGQADFENFFPTRYFKKTYADLLKEFFSDQRLCGLLGQLWQSTGLPNDACAANWAAEVMGSHLLSGNYYIKGGGQRLSEAMAQTLTDAGAVVKTASLVKRIELKDRRAKAVHLENGERYEAPIIVSNASPLQTYLSLVGKEHLSKPYLYKLDTLVPSCSLLTLYLGLDCPAQNVGLDRKTLFVNHDYDNRRAFDAAMKERHAETDYMVTDYTDDTSGAHPPGHGVIQMLEVAGGKAWTEIPRPAYEDKKERVTQTMLDKLGRRFPRLAGHVRMCELGTPRTMALVTRNPYGAVYGWAQTPDQADNFRFGVKSLFKGLYFTGAWSRGGGGGYMGAIINGRVACNEISATEGLPTSAVSLPSPKMTPMIEAPRSEKPENTAAVLEARSYDFEVRQSDLSEFFELSHAACVRIAAEAANRYLQERTSALAQLWTDFDLGGASVFFFSMRFVFVPFAKAKPGQTVSVSVEFLPKTKGKAEINVNIFDKRTGKKLANTGGHALIRQPASRP